MGVELAVSSTHYSSIWMDAFVCMYIYTRAIGKVPVAFSTDYIYGIPCLKLAFTLKGTKASLILTNVAYVTLKTISSSENIFAYTNLYFHTERTYRRATRRRESTWINF